MNQKAQKTFKMSYSHYNIFYIKKVYKKKSDGLLTLYVGEKKTWAKSKIKLYILKVKYKTTQTGIP